MVGIDWCTTERGGGGDFELLEPRDAAVAFSFFIFAVAFRGAKKIHIKVQSGITRGLYQASVCLFFYVRINGYMVVRTPDLRSLWDNLINLAGQQKNMKLIWMKRCGSFVGFAIYSQAHTDLSAVCVTWLLREDHLIGAQIGTL